MKHPKFGDRIEGVHAGHTNPQKFGTFVCVVRRPHGVVNSGTFYRVTDENGNFWEYPYASCINHGNERESAVAKLVARDESDTIGEYIELEKNFAAVTAEHDARWDAERLAAEEAAWREDGWR